MTNASNIKPWMTELWMWADKFKISEEVLPRNQASLLALTDLSIECSQLTNLPEGIGYLYNLTNLTLNCDMLERLPESIGQLSQLDRLTITSHKIQQFPDSLFNLKKLRLIVDVPSDLIDQLPIGVIERYRRRELEVVNISSTKLYTPQMSEYELSNFGFFLTNDNWDEKALIDLKFKAASEFLLGLQTTEKTIKQFDVVDGVVMCRPDEVQRVINMFETVFNEFAGICVADIEKALSFARPAKFIQANVVGMFKSEQVLSQIIDQVPEEITVKSVMFQVESNRSFAVDALKIISHTIDNMAEEDEHIFYNAEVIDKPEHCWMGMIYMVG
jgi:hypothetical protein